MTGAPRALAHRKAQVVRAAGSGVAWARRRRTPERYRAGVTVVTVNWNSEPFLRRMLRAVTAMSPPDTGIVVVDNASTDQSRAHLTARTDVRAVLLPVNVGHGVALDLVVPQVDTEYLAVLDVDAFPVSPLWLQESIAALQGGAQVAGAHLHRNFVHPSFLVTRTALLHEFGLTFRPVGTLSRLDTSAPLFLDVAEALSQRLIIKFGGGKALHLFEPTSVRGPGMAGAVFGGLVYHHMYATQGRQREGAAERFAAVFEEYHPSLAVED